MERLLQSSSCFTAIVLLLCVTTVSSQAPIIEPHVRNLLVIEGNKQVLDCFITVPQQISASLLKWEVPKEAENKYTVRTMTENANTYHNLLTIETFSEDNVGVYKCSFENNKYAEIDLHLVIENKNELEFFYGNKTAVLECTLEFHSLEISGKFLHWRIKNDTEESDPEHANKYKFKEYDNGTLHITRPRRRDAGLYQAQYKVELNKNSEKVELMHDCNVTFKAAPLVLDMHRSENIFEGDELHLKCFVIGYPKATVVWTKDGQEVKENSNSTHVILKSTENYELLLIKSAVSSDSGNYTCIALGEDGKFSSFKSIRVRVKDPLDWLWPVLGIVCEAVVLALIIFACSKIKKNDHVDKPADESVGLLRQGSFHRE